MFKELKVLKLVIIVMILIMIVVNINFESFSGVVSFTSKPSYQLGDEITLNVGSTKDKTIKTTIKISDNNGNLISEEPFNSAINVTDAATLLSNGVESFFSLSLTSKIKTPGIYFINDSIPFFVNSLTKKDITVVYPSAGNLLINRVAGVNAFDRVDEAIWMNRPVGMDEKSKNLNSYLKKDFANYSVEWVSDVDPNIADVLQQSTLVIVYGYSRYVTQDYWNALQSFIQSNGKVLFFTSYFPDYKLHLSGSNHLRLKQNDTSEIAHISDTLFPFHIKYGGYATSLNYKIVNKAIANNDFKLLGNGNVFAGSTLGDYWATLPTENEGVVGKSGIIAINYRLISMGTEEWLASNNFNSESIQTITKKCINYLLKQP